MTDPDGDESPVVCIDAGSGCVPYEVGNEVPRGPYAVRHADGGVEMADAAPDDEAGPWAPSREEV